MAPRDELLHFGGLERGKREAVSGPIASSHGGDPGGGAESPRKVIKPSASAFQTLLD
jgi:hypothetical protein